MTTTQQQQRELTEQGARVRIVEPRGADSQGRYPPVVPGPKLPRFAKKKRTPDMDLQFFPKIMRDEHPRRWKFPAYLDNLNCEWLQALKKFYADPLSFPASLSPEAGLFLHSIVRNARPKVILETGTFVGLSSIWMASALEENARAEREADDDGVPMSVYSGGEAPDEANARAAREKRSDFLELQDTVLHTFDDYGPITRGPWREATVNYDRLGFVRNRIGEAGVQGRVVCHQGNSSFEIRAYHDELKQAGGVDLAFLDADHGTVGVEQDMWATEPVLNTGGLVIFHDTFPQLCGHEGPRSVIDRINHICVGLYEKVDLYLSPINYGLAVLRRIG